jgi:uncharacterized protein YndB with AHSA1/START domain
MNDTTTTNGLRAVNLERDLPHPPQKVWRALTEPQLISEWLMKTDVTLNEGTDFTLSADWGSVDCRVTEALAPERLSYAWETKDLNSVVTWTLTPIEGGTRLRMEQRGFRTDQEPYYRGAQAGWPRFFDQLETVLSRQG